LEKEKKMQAQFSKVPGSSLQQLAAYSRLMKDKKGGLTCRSSRDGFHGGQRRENEKWKIEVQEHT
jgi:hypothetical protein